MVDKSLTNMRAVSTFAISIILILVSFTDAQAASRRNCNRALVITEVTELNFGKFVGSIAGVVTVDTTGARSTTNPPLVSGGTVSPAVFALTTRNGCKKYPVRVRFTDGTLGGPGTMSVNNFISDPVSETFFIENNETQLVIVGGDVNSGTNQNNGVYMGTYTVRFNLKRAP